MGAAQPKSRFERVSGRRPQWRRSDGCVASAIASPAGELTLTAEAELRRLLDIMAGLRDPDGGCPWDQEQNFETIAPYTIEEAYEVADAIARRSGRAAGRAGRSAVPGRLSRADGRGSRIVRLRRCRRTITDKMVRRHPHVFGACNGPRAHAERHQTAAWEAQKAAERAARAETGTLAGIPVGLPALTRAAKLTARAARVGFDWPDADAVLTKLDEEVAELRAELPAGRSRAAGG